MTLVIQLANAVAIAVLLVTGALSLALGVDFALHLAGNRARRRRREATR